MKKATLALKAMVILPVVLVLLSCNPVENETTSATLLVVNDITGTDSEGTDAHYLESDVIYEDIDAGTSTIYADVAEVSLTATLLDPASLLGPSVYNAVTINKYTVDYMRTDGQNTPGEDVPYPFEGTLTITATVDSPVIFPIIVVRAAAKAEPPLVNLHAGRDEGILTVQAKITLFGHDQANREVKAVGYLTIYFANYVND